jgi:hypothetical protein
MIHHISLIKIEFFYFQLVYSFSFSPHNFYFRDIIVVGMFSKKNVFDLSHIY